MTWRMEAFSKAIDWHKRVLVSARERERERESACVCVCVRVGVRVPSQKAQVKLLQQLNCKIVYCMRLSP